MNTKNFVLNGLLVESLLNLAPGQLSILAQALELAQERLSVFAKAIFAQIGRASCRERV